MTQKFLSFIPRVPKKYLLLFASIMWMTGGVMLLTRGTIRLVKEGHFPGLEIVIGPILGLLFYYFMFSKISKKHINRIFAIKINNPYIFSFFDLRGYIMMTIMISMGIILRVSDLINRDVLFSFYLVMGTPLFISALRFYVYWLRYNDIIKAMQESEKEDDEEEKK